MKFNKKQLRSFEFQEKVRLLKTRIQQRANLSLGLKYPEVPAPILLDTIDGVKIFYSSGKLTFTSGFQIDCDGSPEAYNPENTGLDDNQNAKDGNEWVGVVTDQNGDPIIQDDNDPYPGYYVSQTAYQISKYVKESPYRYLDAVNIPYFVLPAHIILAVPEIVLGSRFEVSQNGKFTSGLIGDVGPSNKIGEGSCRAAKTIGVNPDPRNGGDDSKIYSVIVYLGQPWDQEYPLQPFDI